MKIDEILEGVRGGKFSVAQAKNMLAGLSVADLGHSKLDLDRRARTGFGEVVFCAGKTPQQVVDIFGALSANGVGVLGTRVPPETARALAKNFPSVKYDEISRTAVLSAECGAREQKGLIAIVSAGTSDMPVAEEARVCAEFFGSKCATFYDCGVAGLHRLISEIDEIRKANAVIAVAGMEGALASVLAGLVRVPVIAVPTSVGYGASFGGLCALLSMVNSCANGVSVVNIDNGFGAAYTASMINSVAL